MATWLEWLTVMQEFLVRILADPDIFPLELLQRSRHINSDENTGNVCMQNRELLWINFTCQTFSFLQFQSNYLQGSVSRFHLQVTSCMVDKTQNFRVRSILIPKFRHFVSNFLVRYPGIVLLIQPS